MKVSYWIAGAMVMGSLVPLTGNLRHAAPAEEGAPPTLHAITQGPLTVYAHYDGTLESRRATSVASPLSQAAVIIELAPEGAVVTPGDVLARFDPAALERDVIRLEKDARLARARLSQLSDAVQPLQLEEVEAKLGDARNEQADARDLLRDMQELQGEDLVSAQEVAQQERDLARRERQAATLERQLAATRDVLQPAEREQAEAEREAAERELAYLRAQLDGCTVIAREAGLVVYGPLALNGEFRTIRVGDTVYRNQPFLTVADMSNLIVRCHVPEAELGRLGAGEAAVVTPVAFPEMRLQGAVESIGTMAHSIAGRPAWQKYFAITLKLTQASDLLRSGMTVQVQISAYERDAAILIPRRAIFWDGENPTCRLEGGRDGKLVPLTLGLGDDTQYEVLAGVQAGQRVWVP